MDKKDIIIGILGALVIATALMWRQSEIAHNDLLNYLANIYAEVRHD